MEIFESGKDYMKKNANYLECMREDVSWREFFRVLEVTSECECLRLGERALIA